MREIITHVCKCGAPVERTKVNAVVACPTCKTKRKREAAINYYNLKRRKLSTTK